MVTHGLTVPPDEDIVRDIGFIQGMLDGNWFGDPIHFIASRWYPPLFHALAAAVVWLSGVDLLTFWVHTGAWLNLASPLCFWLMNTRLIGPWSAVVATAWLTLFDGAVMGGDEVAGYTPLTLTPALGWPIFYLGIWLLLRWVPRLRFHTAVLTGLLLGCLFLAHTVPALLLSTITLAVVLAIHGPTLRAIAWVAIVACLELALGAIFLMPLVFDHQLRIANPVPGAWVHDLLRPEALGRMLWLSLPGLLALPLLATLPRPVAAALGTWIVVCAAFLLRHYACAAWDGGRACDVLAIAPHHFHTYLQAAWASLIGLALWRASQRVAWRWRVALGAGAVVVGAIALFAADRDGWRREPALRAPDAVLDRAAYRWILAETTPIDVFVTVLPSEPDQMGSAVATVLAAGRRMVAPPEVHSNPYLEWAPRNARRLDYLGGDGDALCRFAAEAEPDAAAWFMLPRNHPPPPAPLLFRSEFHALYRVDAARCDHGVP